MKLKISQTQLESVLAIASYAIPNKPTHPILNSFVLHGNSETQKLTVTAFNLSLGIRAQCDCSVESGGTIALPARLLEEVVAHLPKSDITLEVNDSVAILTHSTGKCQLQTAKPEDFPALPAASDNLEIGFNIKYLLDAIKVIASEQVLIEANKPERPVIVKPLGSSINQLVMVMPVQLIGAARSAPEMPKNPELPADVPTQTPTIEAPVAQNENSTPQKQQPSPKSKTGKKKLQAA